MIHGWTVVLALPRRPGGADSPGLRGSEGWRVRVGLLLLPVLVSTVTVWEKFIYLRGLQGKEQGRWGRE